MKQEYTVTVYTENQVGLLNRIAIIFSRRKINIESLNTSPSEIEGIHRFTIVINEIVRGAIIQSQPVSVRTYSIFREIISVRSRGRNSNI